MKRSLTTVLTTLALLGGLADAARRSGGSFGGSRSVPRTSVPRVSIPPNTAPRPSPSLPSRSSASSQRSAALPSTASVRSSPANRAAAAGVTPAQVSAWKSAPLPAGVPRTALTYSATRSSAYPYQLQNGRYYPYPQSYYRSRNIGADLFRYAVIFMAVDAIAGAVAPDRVVPVGAPTTGNVVTPAASGPNVWGYAGVGLLAAGAAWVVFGRRTNGRRR
ncbi:hypothetical protein E7T09_01865 [Deinococcus sp. KSM4-11]|uniref:hypothetical protein n=1 Tax=Deinococcus sp. KSM4-11 TaxID=2568654 RepID=UPI0010A35784|nr:hypothetical protein [Deinococcus sp. KSM4-11]THF87994.1 hypothetical protein E7T09_01865 [Deinococcus sp. KSM4-11]